MPKFAALVAAVFMSLASLAIGQGTASPIHIERKVTQRVAPDYPELARRMNIHGVVRVEALVRPNGTVKSTRVLGGNPVLANAATTAVEKWKFEPTQSETTEVVQIAFDEQ
jgi:TonB family protein